MKVESHDGGSTIDVEILETNFDGDTYSLGMLQDGGLIVVRCLQEQPPFFSGYQEGVSEPGPHDEQPYGNGFFERPEDRKAIERRWPLKEPIPVSLALKIMPHQDCCICYGATCASATIIAKRPPFRVAVQFPSDVRYPTAITSIV